MYNNNVNIEGRIISEEHFTIEELDAMENIQLHQDPWRDKGYLLKYHEEFEWQIYYNPETNNTVILHYDVVASGDSYDNDWQLYYSYVAT